MRSDDDSVPLAMGPTERAQELFDAIKLIAAGFERAPSAALAILHELVGDHFLSVVEPRGRRDNVVEQRIVGTLWAELEEVLDSRTRAALGKDDGDTEATAAVAAKKAG